MTDHREQPDDFDDPGTAGLLRRFGAQARNRDSGPGERLFEPPAELFAGLRALERSAPGVHAATRRSRNLWRVVSLAAGVLAVAGLAVFVARRATPRLLGESSLSSRPTLERGAATTRVRSGDIVYVHVRFEHAGSARLAMLDSAGSFGWVRDAQGENDARNFSAGDATSWAVELDQDVGHEALVVLAAPRASPALLDRALAAAQAAISGVTGDHAARGAAVRAALGRWSGLEVAWHEFEHVAR